MEINVTVAFRRGVQSCFDLVFDRNGLEPFRVTSELKLALALAAVLHVLTGKASPHSEIISAALLPSRSKVQQQHFAVECDKGKHHTV